MYAAAGGASLASRQARLKQKKLDNVIKQSKTQSSQTSLPKSKPFHALPSSYYDQHYAPPLRLDHHQHKHQCPRYNSSLKISHHAAHHERRHSTISTLPISNDDKLTYKIRSSRSVFNIQNNLNNENQYLNGQRHSHYAQPDQKLYSNRQFDDFPNAQKNLEFIYDFDEKIPTEQIAEKVSNSSCYDMLDLPFSEQVSRLKRLQSTVRRMSSAVASSMQAALLIREQQRLRRTRLERRRSQLPSHISTKIIAPFSQYPPKNWCSQGRTAWIEQEKQRTGFDASNIRQSEAQKLWQKRYRIRDLSTARIIENENFHESAAANTLLYVGLGATAIGMIVAFVGNAEKGFKTIQLRLIGPCLMIFGFICIFLRILICFCTVDCILCRNRKEKKSKNEYVQMEDILDHRKKSRANDKRQKINRINQDRRIAITKTIKNQESSSDEYFNSNASIAQQNEFYFLDTKSDYNSHTGILLTPLELNLQ